MKIYTKKGDQGKTGLLSNRRVLKNDPVLEAYGSADELAAHLGLACGCDIPPLLQKQLKQIQGELLILGTELASLGLAPQKRASLPQLKFQYVSRLEEEIDKMEATLPPLTQFILPGGTPAASHLHVARTVSRRVERLTVAILDSLEDRAVILPYLNRLSDWLFVAARWANSQAGVPDQLWSSEPAG